MIAYKHPIHINACILTHKHPIHIKACILTGAAYSKPLGSSGALPTAPLEACFKRGVTGIVPRLGVAGGRGAGDDGALGGEGMSPRRKQLSDRFISVNEMRPSPVKSQARKNWFKN